MVRVKADRLTYVVRLEALPGPVPGHVRLKRFLKAALRTWNLRCVDLAELTADKTDEADATVSVSGRTSP